MPVRGISLGYTIMKRAVSMGRALAVSAAICLATTWVFAGDTVVEEIVARINNQIVTRSELERNRQQLLDEARQSGVAPTDPKVQEREKNLLRDQIDQQLLLQKAKDLDITADNDLVKRLDEMRKSMNLDSMEALEKEAQKQGISFEDFKLNMKNQIVTQQVISQEVTRNIRISQEEAKQYYEQHKAEWAQPEQVRLGEILLAPEAAKGEEPTPEAVAAAEKKAQQALAELKAGKKWPDVAKTYSTGPTAAQGGDLGYFKRGTLSKELEDKTFAMKADQFTDVVRTKQGFIILKVMEHVQAGVPSYKDAEARVMDDLYRQKLDPALRAYLTKLREQAYIVVKAGYIDTGASPNQTKPIEMATNSPAKDDQAKEKKKKKLLIF